MRRELGSAVILKSAVPAPTVCRGHRPRVQQRTVAGGADPGRLVEGLALNVERAENVSVAGRGEAGRFMERGNLQKNGRESRP
jgi:hypothetical protein